MNIGKATKFLEEKFHLKEWKKKVQDERKRPIISPGVIFKLVREMVFLGQKSLLSVDKFNRSTEVLNWYGKKGKKMVVSDTTMTLSLGGFNCEKLREILKDAYRVSEKEGTSAMTLPSGKKLRIGIVDGSKLGGIMGSVLMVPGIVNAPLDVERYTMGKELEATKIVLNRTVKRFGKGFVNIILGDALYLTTNHISQCREHLGSEVLIKTENECLDIIKDARGLFFGAEGKIGDGIEQLKGLDITRSIEYEIIACSDFRWQELPYEFKIAHVREKKLKPIKGRSEIKEFWIVTTDVNLSGEDMRELYHIRWEIENNVFKRLNSLVKSKRGYIRNPKVKEALLLIWFVGLILLGFYIMWQNLREKKESAKKGWNRIIQEFWLTFYLSVKMETG